MKREGVAWLDSSADLLRSYLTARQFMGVTKGCSSALLGIRAGVPQGSAMGGTCWRAIFAPSSHILAASHGLDMCIYADDINLGSTDEQVLDDGVAVLQSGCPVLKLKTEEFE